jgi:hypothetical protein
MDNLILVNAAMGNNKPKKLYISPSLIQHIYAANGYESAIHSRSICYSKP